MFHVLLQVCDELNNPTLPNIQKWAGHKGTWKCVVSDSAGRMYMVSDCIPINGPVLVHENSVLMALRRVSLCICSLARAFASGIHKALM